jgi:hypothetical protein
VASAATERRSKGSGAAHGSVGAIHVDFGGVPRDVRILGAGAATAKEQRFAGNTVIYAGTDRSASTAATVAMTDEGAVLETHTIIHDETANWVHGL